MGASDSKLVFKQGIFRLSEQKDIAADDPYWTGFWELPESADDVFSLFSPTDIRRTRDNALNNLETLLLAVSSKLITLRNHPSFPDPEIAPERDALNCIRILTRIIPYIYEVDHLEQWEEKFFWTVRRKRTRKEKIKNEVLFDGTRFVIVSHPTGKFLVSCSVFSRESVPNATNCGCPRIGADLRTVLLRLPNQIHRSSKR